MAWFCICNAIPYRKVDALFEQAAKQEASLSHKKAYKEMTDQEKPQCGTCIGELASRVKEHNNKISPTPVPKA